MDALAVLSTLGFEKAIADLRNILYNTVAIYKRSKPCIEIQFDGLREIRVNTMERYRFSEHDQSLLESIQTPFAIYQLVDKRVVTVVLSDGFCNLFGYEDRSKAYIDMDREMYADIHPDDTARIADAAYRFANDGSTYEVIYRAKPKGKKAYQVIHAYGKHIFTPTGVRLAQVSYTNEGPYLDEVGAGKAAINQALSNALHEQSVLKANFYDALTGLPNLSYFFDLAETGKTAMRRRGEYAVLLYIDLNGMKYFNHKNGFAEGDQLLHSFAKLLIQTFSNENCGHVSADRFAVFTEEKGLEDKLRLLFQKAKETNGGKSLPVRVGIYPTRLEDVTVSFAYDRAKIACDSLRKTVASCFNYYSKELRDQVKMRQYLQTNLDRAIAENWIQVYYQPIIRAVSGKVCDVEALARWIDPVEGFLSPADFIPYLEEAGIIYKLDLFVLGQVLEKIKKQSAFGFYTVPHSINLSRSDFDACDIVEEVRKRVDEAGVDRKNITIEITESIIGSDFEFMKNQVKRFRDLGFPVWMDDFGSGYSSLDVLQSIEFDLLKFDMGFLRKLDEGDNGKIILTELMKMATSLGVETICEGVETAEQVRFLQEIGCSKLQGYYYSKPISRAELRERFQKGIQIGYENPEEASYYEAMGRVNLYDLAVIANTDENAFHNSFNNVPIGIIEVREDMARFVRSNPSYRNFIHRVFGIDLSYQGGEFAKFSSPFMKHILKACCEQESRSFYDEKLPDGSIVHSFARKIGVNQVTGNIAVAVAILSITDPDDGATYVDIARALAADYYSIYVVDLETEQYIEYTSPVGGQEMAVERHGTDFFEMVKRGASRIYEEDRETFYAAFTKELIVRALDRQGVFTAMYRLIDSGVPVYVNMKVTRMQPGGSRIIMGISNIDAQMKQKEHFEAMQRERATLVRVMALSDGYLSLYTIDPMTDHYVEYTCSDDYATLGAPKEGDDFFNQLIENAPKYLYSDDQAPFRDQFTKEKIMNAIREKGFYITNYRIMIKGEPIHVILRIAPFMEDGERKLLVGVRTWRERK